MKGCELSNLNSKILNPKLGELTPYGSKEF